MMSNEPPQGAQPQHSGNPGGMREAAQALIDRYYSSTLWVDMIDEARALRTALAAPEGPAPEPVAWVDERAIAWLAQRLGKQSFITTVLEAKKSFERPMPLYATTAPEAPPPVEARQSLTAAEINALPERVRAYIAGIETLCDPAGLVRENMQMKDVVRELSASNRIWRDRAALASPQSELAKSLAWSNDDGWRAQRLATEFHEIYERLAPSFGYETRPDTKQFDPNSKNGKLMIAVCGNILAALAAPAGAIQPQKCQICKGVIENCTGDDCDGTGEFQAHLVGAPVTLSDAASEKEKQA